MPTQHIFQKNKVPHGGTSLNMSESYHSVITMTSPNDIRNGNDHWLQEDW